MRNTEGNLRAAMWNFAALAVNFCFAMFGLMKRIR